MLLAHLAATSILTLVNLSTPSDRLVRVLLNRIGGVPSLELESEGGIQLFLPNSQVPFAEARSGEPLEVKAVGEKLQVASVMATEIIVLPKGSKLQVSGKTSGLYRGRLRLRAERGSILAINELGLEAYLMGVLAAEMPPSFAPEALKAQAVAARTFALARMAARCSAPYDLDDTTASQTYLGVKGERPETNEAVRLTSNTVLLFDGEPIQAMYCTVSGGVTAGNDEVFGGKRLPYLRPVIDVDKNGKPYGEWSPYFRWQVFVTEYPGIGAVNSIEILEHSESGRASRIRIAGRNGTVTVSGVEFRNRLGVNQIRSLLIDEIVPSQNGVLLKGRGWGHGVGLCQAGAQGRALAGQTFEQILQAYYPNAALCFVPDPVLLARSKR